MYKRVAKKKPLLTKLQKRRRFDWAKEMKSRGKNFWRKVIFSDESRYCQFSDSGRVWVWRRSSDQMEDKFLQQTVKYGGVNVMVWGAIWYGGRSSLIFCDGHVNAEKYIGILKDGLLPLFTEDLDKTEFFFMEDGAPCHRAKNAVNWKRQQGLNILPWPGQSPDMNPIENVWHILQQNMHKRSPKPGNKQDLMAALSAEWTNISQDVIDRWIETMGNRIQTLCEKRGGATKY